MRTIIQTIGPLYGEVVNGSVFGQPNGSVARPPQNAAVTAVISGTNGKLTKTTISGGQIAKYTLSGVSLDVSDYSGVEIVKTVIKNAADTVIATGGGHVPAYTFSDAVQGPANLIPTDGDSLTMTVELRDVYGNVLVTSNALTITAVVPE